MIWLCALAPGRATDYFVATNGLPIGIGSAADPLDLATAISATGPAGPGDTIYMRGGVYRGIFTSDLRGSTSNYVTLSGFPGERAIIDGNINGNGTTAVSIFTIRTNGAWSIYRDFETTYSYLNIGNGVQISGQCEASRGLVILRLTDPDGLQVGGQQCPKGTWAIGMSNKAKFGTYHMTIDYLNYTGILDLSVTR